MRIFRKADSAGVKLSGADQKELHEEYQYLAEVNEGDGVATGLINEYGECVVACMFDEITMGMTDEGFRILAYKSVSTDKQGESEAKRYYVLDERGQILEEHGEGIEVYQGREVCDRRYRQHVI